MMTHPQVAGAVTSADANDRQVYCVVHALDAAPSIVSAPLRATVHVFAAVIFFTWNT